MMWRRTLVGIGPLCCLLVLGCGGSGGLPTAKVSGKVTLDGNPLGKGMVVFTPAAARAATGTIQPDGTYTLKTYKPGDGAVLGKHRVAVMARDVEPLPPGGPTGPPKSGRWLIPEFYGDSATSGLTFEVTADGSNVFDIRLSSTAVPSPPAAPKRR